LEVIIVPDADGAGRLVAEHIAWLTREGDGLVLGVATGSTPGPVYRALTALAESGDADIAGVTVFALDEYVGLAPGDPRSYRATIGREVAVPLGIPAEHIHVPDGAPRGCGRRASATSRRSVPRAVSTFRSSASAATVTSSSTSPARRSPRQHDRRP